MANYSILASSMTFHEDEIIDEKRVYRIAMPNTKWYDFEELLNNIEQDLGKPSHVFHIGHSDINWKISDDIVSVKMKGSDTARGICFDAIESFLDKLSP